MLIALVAVLAFSIICAAKAKPTPQPSDGILHHLNAAIRWYRHVASLDVTAGQPSDVLYLESARNAASMALQLAFQASLAQAQLTAQTSGTAASPAASNANDQQQGIAKALAD